MLIMTADHETTTHLPDPAIIAPLTRPRVCANVLAGDYC
jgi:hypothetical protein